jgi:hypothetical protein
VAELGFERDRPIAARRRYLACVNERAAADREPWKRAQRRSRSAGRGQAQRVALAVHEIAKRAYD